MPPELDAGYLVLVDKDGLFDSLTPATGKGYRTTPPDESTYLTLVNDFFVGVPYVVKSILRSQIMAAKWCLDFDMRYVYLVPMLEWHAAADHQWLLSPGVHGKHLQRDLAQEVWRDLAASYAGMDAQENLQALFAMMAIFRRVATDVARDLGFTYPLKLDQSVSEHARETIRRGL